MIIRDFEVEDADDVVEVLKLSNQYLPLVEGPEAMKRVRERKSAVYLVAEKYGRVVGVVRGVYDGSRALIHQMSIDRISSVQCLNRCFRFVVLD